MKRLIPVLLLLLGLSAPAWGQTWYYNVDEEMQISPETIDFNPTTSDLLCAALLGPPGTGGEVSVSNVTLPPGCPDSPPVVVWGVNPDSGETVYAALIRVKFWGEKRYTNSRYGVNALIQVLQDNYGLNIEASGDLNKADAQFLPPLTTPPVDSPPAATTGWYTWRDSQLVSVDEPEVSDEENHWILDDTCWNLYRDNCWSAVLTWALPVRLVVHGGENGDYQITVTPDKFDTKTADTLSVSGGRLVHPRVVPYTR
ncbi:hypothetical protein [Oceanithermus sp.]